MPPQEELAPPTRSHPHTAGSHPCSTAGYHHQATHHWLPPDPSIPKPPPDSAEFVVLKPLSDHESELEMLRRDREVAHAQLLDMERLRAMKLVKQPQDQCMVLGSPPLPSLIKSWSCYRSNARTILVDLYSMITRLIESNRWLIISLIGTHTTRFDYTI